MDERWVLNASPVIALAHAGHTHLIAALSEQAVIPEAVAAEVRAGPPDDPARQWIEAGFAVVIGTPAPPPELLAWDLGAGETAVLAHAMAIPGWIAVLDDGAARKCARSFRVPTLGTLGISVRAKQRGLIPSAADVIKALRSAGLRVDDRLVQAVLREAVDEDWPAAESRA